MDIGLNEDGPVKFTNENIVRIWTHMIYKRTYILDQIQEEVCVKITISKPYSIWHKL